MAGILLEGFTVTDGIAYVERLDGTRALTDLQASPPALPTGKWWTADTWTYTEINITNLF